MTGDILQHHQIWGQAEADARAEGRTGYDYDPIFAGQRKLISGADLAICHQETVFGRKSGPFSGYPVFNSPPQVLRGVKDAGYDACTTGSNHSLDQGLEGITRTLDDMDAAGIKHTGTARSAKEAATPLIMDVKGVKVALLEYAYGTNGIPMPEGKPWAENIIDKRKILAQAHQAKTQGADVVILAMHWGTEDQHELNEQQAELGPALIKSPDIDLIYGHHVHVVQPWQKVGDEWIAYGLGNYISAQAFLSRLDVRDGVLARFTFSPKKGGGWHVSRAEYAPSYVGQSPLHIIDVAEALNDPSTPAWLRRDYRASWKRTVGYVNALGAKKDGLRPITVPHSP
jgi:poly-gamma-glutamate synthesis protein (capsule biosynthesis protein)